MVLRSVAHTVSYIVCTFTICKLVYSLCVMSLSHSLTFQVSVIARHEFARGQWTELNQFILQHCNSPDPKHREVSWMIITCMCVCLVALLQGVPDMYISLCTCFTCN